MRLGQILQAQGQLALPLAQQVGPAELRFAPELLETTEKGEFVPRVDANEVDVLLGHARPKSILRGRLTVTRPLRHSADRVLVQAFQRVLDSEARADDKHHEVIAEVEWILLFRQRIGVMVVAPELPDRPKVRKTCGFVRTEPARVLSRTEYEYPLGQREVCLGLIALVAFDASKFRFDV